MNFSILFSVTIAPVLAVLRLVKVGARTTGGAIFALGVGLSIPALSTQFLWADQPVYGEVAVTSRPIQRPAGDYVGSAACRSCHPHYYATWHDSYHRTMTQVATAESVIGNFNNVRLSGKDLNVRLFRQGNQFLVEMNLSNPPLNDVYPVVMTTGSHNRQVYWLGSSTDSPLMVLPYMFLRAEQKWIPRHSAYINPMCLQERPESAVLKADFGRWSYQCIKCHTTRPYLAAETDSPARPASATQVVEFGISCEACHGPGAEHVRVNRDPTRRYTQRLAGGPDATIVNPADLPHDRASQVCGQCHSVIIHRKRWVHNGYTYRPGEDLAADPNRFVMRGRLDLMPHNRPRDLPHPSEMNSFWSDGMIRCSGREYNGLIDSPCFQRGEMSCLSCHQMHQSPDDPRKRQDWADDQLKFGTDGNSACLQCHDQLKSVDRLTLHTHHGADSAGSNCYNCHMPYTTYGLLKAIRSHQISSPSVTASLETGRPNACNQCHQDKTLAWTADHLSRWYEIPKPKLSGDEQQIAATALWALRGDAGQRVLMAWSYGWEDALKTAGNHWQAPYLAQLLEDRYDAVRFIAHRSLRRLPGFQDFEYDFVGPPGHRAAARQRALQVWAGSQKSLNRPFARPVLIDGRGHVLETEFQRLWKQRDDRPMEVGE